MADPRSHRRYKKLHGEFHALCSEADAPCWICGQAIDYDAELSDETNRSRFQLDHYYPVADYPELALDPANFRASHAGCNNARSNDAPHPGVGRLSRDWTVPLFAATDDDEGDDDAEDSRHARVDQPAPVH